MEDVIASALLQRSAADSDSEQISDPESENDEVLVSEGEELEEVDESAFGKLMAGAVEQSKCVWLLKCSTPKLTFAGKQASEKVQF